MKPLILDICCGGGGASTGLTQAGFEIIGVEYEPAIAHIHSLNQAPGSRTICADFRSLSPHEFAQAGVSGIWSSFPCQSHSRRRSSDAPVREDKELVLDFIPWLDIIEPKFLVVENVVGYEHSQGLRMLCDRLQELGYNWKLYCPEVTYKKGWMNPKHWEGDCHWAGRPLNAKYFGVAQDRERVILLATRDHPVPDIPIQKKTVGWKEAIAPVLGDLPQSTLTNAQWNAVKAANTTEDLLIQRVAYQKLPRVRKSFEQAWTLTAHLADDGKGGSRSKVIDVLLNNSEGRSLTISALAILSGFSPEYKFNGRMSVDMRVLGNCVTPPLAKAIGEALLTLV